MRRGPFFVAKPGRGRPPTRITSPPKPHHQPEPQRETE